MHLLCRLGQRDVIHFKRIAVDDLHVRPACQSFGEMWNQCLVKLNRDDVCGLFGQMMGERAEARADFEDEIVGLYLGAVDNAAGKDIIDQKILPKTLARNNTQLFDLAAVEAMQGDKVFWLARA